MHPPDSPQTPAPAAVDHPHPVLLRASAAIAAATVTFAVFGALLVAFDKSSSPQWLAPTQEVIEMVEGCDSLVNRAQRDHCKRSFVAARLSKEAPPVQLAKR